MGYIMVIYPRLKPWACQKKGDLLPTIGSMKNGKRLGFSVQEQIEKAKKEKNWKFLCKLLNAFWHSAPDEQYIHTIPGWSILCELCSEDWVFYNRQEQSSC